jgi:hypothetical protein
MQPRRRPNRSPALGFPTMLEAGKNKQCHDDASKEVTAPAGVTVVRITQSFHPALMSTPTPSDTLQESPLSSPLTRSELEKARARCHRAHQTWFRLDRWIPP